MWNDKIKPLIAAIKMKRPDSSFKMPDNMIMSLVLVAALVASLVIWLALDSSSKVTALQSQPEKINQRIANIEGKQTQTIESLNKQVATLQQQLNELTKRVSNKNTAQWQSTLSKPAPQAAQPPKTPHSTATVKKKPPTAKRPAAKKPKPKPISKAATHKTVSTKARSAFEVPQDSKQGWMVNILSLASEKSAINEVMRLREKGINAEFVRFPSKNKVWFRIRVSGFETKKQAIAYQRFLKKTYHIDAWKHKSP
ncbi:MAG: SPOR domain-containing protein [Mariprofundus sp.]|nr:SPOR domain-containing protein [Mariprofundus sp.]